MKKIEILIIGYTPAPYPPISGGKISLFNSIDYLRKKIEVTLILKSTSITDQANTTKLREIWPDVRIIEYLKKPPGKNKTKRKARLRSLWFSLKKPSIHKKNSYSKPNFIFPFSIMDYSFITFLSQHFEKNKDRYDIVQIEFTPNLNLINLIPKNIKSVFLEIESRHKVLRDYYEIKDKPEYSPYNSFVVENVRFIEHAYMNQYDAVFALNEADRTELQNSLPHLRIFNCPFPVSDEKFRSHDNILNDAPDKLLFLGSDNHYPNVDGLSWFIKNVTPKLPLDIKIYITGNWSPEFVQKHNSPQIIFTGFVDSLEEIMKNSILIVPVRIGGGGIRAKILEAMAFGIPVITTSLAIKGMTDFVKNENILVSNSADQFVESVLSIHDSPNEYKKLVLNANDLIRKKYSQKHCGEERIKAYQEILQLSSVSTSK